MRLACLLFVAVLVVAVPEKRKKRGACPPPGQNMKLKDFDDAAKDQGVGKIARNLKIVFGKNADDNCKTESKGIDIKVEDMFAQCKEFCGHGALPIVMGSEEYGMDLEDMNNICLGISAPGKTNKGIKASDDDLKGLMQCSEKSKALDNIEDALVNFLAKWKVMDFGILLLESDILQQIDKIEQKLTTPQFRDSIRRKDPEEKVAFMKRVYRGMLEGRSSSTLSMHSVKEDVKNLKKYSDLMWKVIKENLADFKTYITECNSFFPRVKEQTYLKDLCIQDGGRCLEVSAGCCCGINPLVPTNAPTSAPTMVPTSAPTEPPTPIPPTAAPPPTPQPTTEDGEPSAGADGDGDGDGGGTSTGGDDDFFDDDGARRKLMKAQKITAHIERKTTQQHQHQRRRLLSVDDTSTSPVTRSSSAALEVFGQHSEAKAEAEARRELTAFPGMCTPGQNGVIGDNAQFGVSVEPWNKGLEIRFGKFADKQCRSRVQGRQITTENLFAECKNFCGEGAVPIVLGTDTFGLNLNQMKNVCLDSAIKSDKASMKTAKQCPAKKQALRDVENSVADFLGSLRVLNYAKLRFVSDIRDNVEEVEKKLQTPRFFDRMSKSDNKAKDLRRIYGSYLGGMKGDPVGSFDLTDDAKRLAGKAEMMETMMNQKMQNVIEFFDECDDYYPVDGTSKEFLLDICRQSGSRCLTGDEDQKALHAGCCCGHNPLVKLTSMLKAVREGGRHLQEASLSPCAKALLKSESQVNGMKEKTGEQELTRTAVNQIEFGGVCGRAEEQAEPQVRQYLDSTTHPQVQQAKLALEAKYAGDVPLEPLPEGGCVKDLAETDGAATCGWFSKCSKRRRSVCIDGHCQCKVGTCSDGAKKGAICVENESAIHNEEVRCVTDLTETDSSATCSMFSACKGNRLAKCVKGKCTCDGGKICSNRSKKYAQCVFQRVPTPFPAPNAPAPTPVAPCVTDLTTTDKKATCGWFSCNSKRNAVCKSKKCTCADDSCSNMASKDARCIPRVLGGSIEGGHSFLNSDGAVSASADTSSEVPHTAVAVFSFVGMAALAAVAAVMYAVTKRLRAGSNLESQKLATPATSAGTEVHVENTDATEAL